MPGTHSRTGFWRVDLAASRYCSLATGRTSLVQLCHAMHAMPAMATWLHVTCYAIFAVGPMLFPSFKQFAWSTHDQCNQPMQPLTTLPCRSFQSGKIGQAECHASHHGKSNFRWYRLVLTLVLLLRITLLGRACTKPGIMKRWKFVWKSKKSQKMEASKRWEGRAYSKSRCACACVWLCMWDPFMIKAVYWFDDCWQAIHYRNGLLGWLTDRWVDWMHQCLVRVSWMVGLQIIIFIYYIYIVIVVTGWMIGDWLMGFLIVWSTGWRLDWLISFDDRFSAHC